MTIDDTESVERIYYCPVVQVSHQKTYDPLSKLNQNFPVLFVVLMLFAQPRIEIISILVILYSSCNSRIPIVIDHVSFHCSNI